MLLGLFLGGNYLICSSILALSSKDFVSTSLAAYPLRQPVLGPEICISMSFRVPELHPLSQRPPGFWNSSFSGVQYSLPRRSISYPKQVDAEQLIIFAFISIEI